MLSILVPVYNFDVRLLIEELQNQASNANIVFEIIVVDDCSTDGGKVVNSEVNKLAHLTYVELPQNKGRSGIRNWLTEKAKYDYLLYLDCDSKIDSKSFIVDYIHAIKQNPKSIIFGGRAYEKTKPANPQFMLRWKYGVKRETISFDIREQSSFRYFMTNNFIVPKSIMLDNRFDEKIIGYGYEDTLFAQDVKRKGIAIVHINNVLLHIGLETTEEFLGKTLEGMKNLAYIISKGGVEEDVKLFRVASQIKRAKLSFIVKFLWRIFGNLTLRNLKSNNPNLMLFDFYKLAHLLPFLTR